MNNDPKDSYYKVHCRMDLIRAAVTGLCANPGVARATVEAIVDDAVNIADMVIERLDAEEGKETNAML